MVFPRFTGTHCSLCALYATLHYSTLLYATLRYSTLLYAILRYATLRYAILRYAILRYATLRYATILPKVPGQLILAGITLFRFMRT
jgi:uncharacterized protein YjbI with pentapeptide repeats